MARMQTGRVVSVYPDRGTCDVAMESTGQVISGIRMSKDDHPSYGDMLLVGKTTGPGTTWSVVNRIYEAGKGNAALLEGERGYVSPSGSRVVLHTNGDVVIADKGLSRIALIPSRHLLEMSLLKWHVRSNYGNVLFEPEVFSVNVGGGGGDVQLSLGSPGDNFGAGNWAGGRDLGCSLRVGSLFHVEIAKDGGISMVSKDLRTQVQDETSVELQGDADIRTKNVTVDAPESTYDVAVGSLYVVAEQTISYDATLFKVTADRIELDDANGPVPDGAQLLEWFANDFAIVNGKISPAALASFPLKVLSKRIFV